jgi:hypothetical protein
MAVTFRKRKNAFIHVNFILCTRFEVFTAVKIQVLVFWVVTLCSVVVGYRRLHLQGEDGGLTTQKTSTLIYSVYFT